MLAKSSAAFEKLTQLPSQREVTGTGVFCPLLPAAVERIERDDSAGTVRVFGVKAPDAL